MGLLLLRAALGIALSLYALKSPAQEATGFSLGEVWLVIEVIASLCMVLGFITPVMSLIAFVDFAVLVHVSRAYPEFNSNVAEILALMVGAGVALAGPGAYSLDALLFGRREVIVRTIPGSRQD